MLLGRLELFKAITLLQELQRQNFYSRSVWSFPNDPQPFPGPQKTLILRLLFRAFYGKKNRLDLLSGLA